MPLFYQIPISFLLPNTHFLSSDIPRGEKMGLQEPFNKHWELELVSQMPFCHHAKHEDELKFFLQKLLILLPLAFIHLVAEGERQRLQNVGVKPVYRSSCLKWYARRQEKSLVIFCFLELKDWRLDLGSAGLAWDATSLLFFFKSCNCPLLQWVVRAKPGSLWLNNQRN